MRNVFFTLSFCAVAAAAASAVLIAGVSFEADARMDGSGFLFAADQNDSPLINEFSSNVMVESVISVAQDAIGEK